MEIFRHIRPAEQKKKHRIKSEGRKHETQIENISFWQSQAAWVHFEIDPE